MSEENTVTKADIVRRLEALEAYQERRDILCPLPDFTIRTWDSVQEIKAKGYEYMGRYKAGRYIEHEVWIKKATEEKKRDKEHDDLEE